MKISHKCQRREEITVETNTTEGMFELLYVSIAVDIALKTKLSRDLPSEILLINHPKKICKKIELSNSTSFQNFISKCNIVSVAPFTPESLKLDQELTEDQELHLKEFKETPLVKLLEMNQNDMIVYRLILTIFTFQSLLLNLYLLFKKNIIFI